MSEPQSWVASFAISPDGLRSWLAAPCPPPERWTDWDDLEVVLPPGAFDLAARLAGRWIGAILAEFAAANRGGWHFEWRAGALELVALQGAVSWREHLLFLCALRSAGDHGGGPGLALAHGYVWAAAGTAWGLRFGQNGGTHLSFDLEAAERTRLDLLALPMVAAARAGEAGPAQDHLGLWMGG